MKYRFIKSFLLVICAAFLCTECAQPEEPAATEAPAVEEVKPSETAAPEEAAEAEEEKAELPPPPDIDINSWEYLYAGVSQDSSLRAALLTFFTQFTPQAVTVEMIRGPPVARRPT